MQLRGVLNDFLENWGLPAFLAIMLLGAITGIIMNLKKINSTNFEEKKEGLFSVLYVLLYVLIAVAVIAAIVTAIAQVNVSI